MERLVRRSSKSEGGSDTHHVANDADGFREGLKILRELGVGKFTPPVNNGFAFQRSTRPFFRFFPGGFGAGPNLLDTGEEQVAAMLLVEWHGIVVA